MREDSQPGKGSGPIDLDSDSGFWNMTDRTAGQPLKKIFDAALREGISPSSLLVAILARITACLPPCYVIDRRIRGSHSLNLFMTIVCKAGRGKTNVFKLAGRMARIPSRPHVVEGVAQSTEGLVGAYLHRKSPEGENREYGGVFLPSTLSFIVHYDELARLGGQKKFKGSSLISTLNTGWVGGMIARGSTIQDPDSSRMYLPEGSYRLVMTGATQYRNAGIILEEDTGLLQRMLWTIPTLQDECPQMVDTAVDMIRQDDGSPDPVVWGRSDCQDLADNCPTSQEQFWQDVQSCQGVPEEDQVQCLFPDKALEEIRRDKIRNVLGLIPDEETHDTFMREKIAVPLSLLLSDHHFKFTTDGSGHTCLEVGAQSWEASRYIIGESHLWRNITVRECEKEERIRQNRKQAERDSSRDALPESVNTLVSCIRGYRGSSPLDGRTLARRYSSKNCNGVPYEVAVDHAIRENRISVENRRQHQKQWVVTLVPPASSLPGSYGK